MYINPPSKNSWPCILNPLSKPGATWNRTKTPTSSASRKTLLMVDRLWTWRQNLALERRLRYAKLKGNACVEDIDYRASRPGSHADPLAGQRLRLGQPAREHLLVGPTGVGKSWLACALAQKTRDGYLVLYTRAAALFRDLALARADGSQRNLLAGSAVSMSWSSMTGPWRRCRNPSGATSGKSVKSVIKPIDDPDLTSSRRAMARADRRCHHRRRYTRPARAQRSSHRAARRSMRKTRAKKTESKEEKETWQPGVAGNRSPCCFSRRWCEARGFKRQPLPPRPHPRSTTKQPRYARRKLFQLDDLDHFPRQSISPASLRSDLDRNRRNSDRFHAVSLIDITGIRISHRGACTRPPFAYEFQTTRDATQPTTSFPR